LTVQYLVTQWEKQNGLCYYTGLPMDWKANGVKQDGMSLDRLSPDLGYVCGNVVFCMFQINTMKGKSTEDEFYRRMELILCNKGRKSSTPTPC
jgi:hypothetical protein